ncbi:MAG: rod shape-determining protein MreC [Thermodesulfobacteriota bacterium]
MFSKKKLIKFIVLFFLIVNLSALIAAGRGGGRVQSLGRAGLDLFSPVEELVSDVSGYLSDIWSKYFNLILVQKKNTELKKELNRYYAKKTLYREVHLENQRLKKLLKFTKEIDSEYLAAQVTGKDSSKWFKTIIVNRGKNSGVGINFPVIVPAGVVGQVIEVSQNYSKVLLITDRMSGVDSLVQENRGRGIVSGTKNDVCELKYMLRKFDLEKGQHIITSGMDGVFPKGLRIGEITQVRKKTSGIFQEVSVKPFVNFEKLEEVLIVFKNSTKES